MCSDGTAAVIEVQPVTPNRWNDLADLFERRGPRGGTPVTSNCWCMEWRGLTGDRNPQPTGHANARAGG